MLILTCDWFDFYNTHWHTVTSHFYVLLYFTYIASMRKSLETEQMILRVLWVMVSKIIPGSSPTVHSTVTLSDMGIVPENSQFIDQSFPLKDPVCSGCIWLTFGTGPGVNHSCHCVRQTGAWCHCFKWTHRNVIIEQAAEYHPLNVFHLPFPR